MLDRSIQRYHNYSRLVSSIVTVFLRTYNRSEYLKLAINSLLSSDYFNQYALVILDNCSTDDTKQIVESCVSANIIYLRRQSKDNYTKTKFWIFLFDTKYMIILHDDDILEKNYVEKMVEYIRLFNVTAVSASSWLIDSYGKRIEKQYDDICDNLFFSKDDYLLNYLKNKRITMNFPSTIYETAFLKNHKGVYSINAGPCLDDFLFFQICRFGGKLCIVPERLINYRIHDNQDSNRKKNRMEIELFDFLLLDKYYYDILKRKILFVKRVFWKSFKISFLRYNDGQLSIEEYRALFNSRTFFFLRRHLKTRLFSVIVKLLFKNNALLYKLYKVRGK